MIDTDDLKRRVDLAALIRSYGADLHKQGSKLFAHCPFHEDSTPSFSLYRKDGIERAGCKGCNWDGDAIQFVMGMEHCDFQAAVKHLEGYAGGTAKPAPAARPVSSKPKRKTKPGKTLAEYDYGNFQVVRRETLDADTGEWIDNKHFSQRQPDPNGGWIWNLTGVERQLYRFPSLKAAQTIWIVEGEKDVHSLEAAGVIATTNAGGAKAPWLPQYTATLAGKDVIICGDSDQPGQEHAATVAAHLNGTAASIRMIHLPAGLVKDVTDWLEAGQTIEALLEMAVPYPPPREDPRRETPPPPPKQEPKPKARRTVIVDDHGPRLEGWRSNFPVNDSHGNPKPVFANALYALRAAPEWANVLFFNEFSVRVVARNEMPWGAGGQGDHPWTDHEDRLVAEWLQHNGVLVAPKVAGEAVATVAREHCFHPVREYLAVEQWDSTPRLDCWLTDYLGVPPSNFSAAVGARWIISAVARIFQPGCKADYCIILEGEQGARKSTSLQTLFEPWFTDEIADLGSKDSSIQLQGVWCIEIAELDSMSRGDVSKIKAFMTRSTDRFRPPYGHRSEDFPRQNVFAGSVNQNEYLRDPTGGRRFWPVKAGTISIPALKADRDQLWAEALFRYRQHEVWYLDDLAIEAEARQEQMERYEGDAWDPLILTWLENPEQRYDEHGHPVGEMESVKGRVTITDILVHCIAKPKAQWTQADKLRVQRCLTAARYSRQRIGSREKRQWVYVSQAP